MALYMPAYAGEYAMSFIATLDKAILFGGVITNAFFFKIALALNTFFSLLYFRYFLHHFPIDGMIVCVFI